MQKLAVLTLIYSIIFFYSNPLMAQDRFIDVTLISTKDSTSYDKTKQCKLYFSYKNNSYGTIHNLSIELDGFDDRGEKVGELLSASADPFGSFFGSRDAGIPVNKTYSSKSSATFKSACKYLRKISAVKVKNKYCVIRNLPEKVNCLNLVRVGSKVKSISFAKK